jgi:3-oxoacyl-[acyl-carrier-protein] synthase II
LSEDVQRVRIAVTGVGLVTPLGTTRAATWNALLHGKRAARWLSGEELGDPSLPAGPAPGQRWFGCPVETAQLPPLSATFPPGRLLRFALTAAREALEQAQLQPAQLTEAACVIGSSKPDLRPIDAWLRRSAADDPNSSSPPPPYPPSAEALFGLIAPSEAATVIGTAFGCGGPVLCPVAACATGLVSLIRGADLIRSGEARIAIAGGADASLHPGLLASYRRLGVLAAPEGDPASACRPFDLHRTGFAVGEGAGMLVLEEWDHALARGATPLAEWLEGRIGSDPSGLTAVDETGIPLARLVRTLLDATGLAPAEIQMANLHGTATRSNDRAEANALRSVFGIETDRLVCSALKGALGHLMGAAGAVETACAVLALQAQTAPPTANHLTADPESRLHFNATGETSCRHLLKLSLGFGGQLAAALLRRP